MHPTADTIAFIFSKGAGRRVMPGVMPQAELLSITPRRGMEATII